MKVFFYFQLKGKYRSCPASFEGGEKMDHRPFGGKPLLLSWFLLICSAVGTMMTKAVRND